ncbi:GH116 family glycosyl hydrolase [Paenibacillus montanisoli]|uniref:Beta-glucosidase n=1 Tax=Paenibacillus montanisoli TaxID=2081970 RepID=A0A328U5A7_9BACL|nr:GH116 family glycosyl hydrolase [Paenibacillus montanisoli]RAP77790.1 hypothetical protein DL346_04855 [Paenibacillus montanisoli]
MKVRTYNGIYRESWNSRIAFPLGGMGAGMLCLGGGGGLSQVSLRNYPDLPNEPYVYSAVCIKSDEGSSIARVLEGPIARWKLFGYHQKDVDPGHYLRHYGLPRFKNSAFTSRFPFATVRLQDDKLPIEAEITGWSPFAPLHADDSSLPAAALEYTFTNRSDKPLELVYSFHAKNFMASHEDTGEVLAAPNGFILHQPAAKDRPWEQGAFCAAVDDQRCKVNYAWFRGGWFDSQTMAWHAVEAGEMPSNPPITEGKPSPGASLYVPIALAPGERQTVKLMLSWFVPETDYRYGDSELPAEEPCTHKPWYAGRYENVQAVASDWARRYDELYALSKQFSDCYYDTTLPAEVMEASSANLSILKSPTVLRQTDGRLWSWEGVNETTGSCHGSCTHVWNYAQALPHLFPAESRALRATEVNECQDEHGHQNFRTPLPIRPAAHNFHAAADGQLGGIMNTYREWRISGDSAWLKQLWPKVKQSLRFCIESWDPRHRGVLEEPHHNTYDIEFWGANGMCTSLYLGALKAASRMAEHLGESAAFYETLYESGRDIMENQLFNGEYYEQHIQWEGLREQSPLTMASININYSPEAVQLFKEEGPKYQYGKGCLSDGVIGAWIAEMCGLGEILDRNQVRSHLLSVFKYNFRKDLTGHANLQRSGFAVGEEGGLLLCTWPHGGQLKLPFVYSNEVWTGIEYQVASHLMLLGCVEEGLEIVRTCRDRYDGTIRNPYDECECGHWYARAMASYGLIQGMTGIRYDAPERTLYVSPSIGGDFRSFLSTSSGYGTVGVRGGEPFFEPVYGEVQIDRFVYTMEK